jgi:hypothetical protein
MAVTETPRVAALSPPAVRDALAERSFRLVSSGALSQPLNDPTTRLVQLRDQLAGTSFDAPGAMVRVGLPAGAASADRILSVSTPSRTRASPQALYW